MRICAWTLVATLRATAIATKGAILLFSNWIPAVEDLTPSTAAVPQNSATGERGEPVANRSAARRS
jgi:hypothetical protein